MSDSTEQIREHIEVLTEFEGKYREFVRLLEEDRQSDFGSRNTARIETLQREILEAVPRADIAAKASGHWLTTTHAPAMGGGVRSNHLGGQVLDIEESGLMNDGLSIPRMILQMFPMQLGALRMKLAEAEKRKPTRAERKAAKQQDQGAPPEPGAESVPQQPWEHPVGKRPEKKRPWHENPWIVTIGGGVVVGVIILLLTNA